MNVSSKFIRIEILFNSIELTLSERWTAGHVPAHFISRPVDHLCRIVKVWWHIYQESTCAGQQLDRNVWERRVDYPAETLDSPSLVASLKEIQQLINLVGLLSFRPLHSTEVAALCLLANMVAYYT